MRVEQLYVFPRAEISAELDKYRTAKEVTWCQQEPATQGALFQMRDPRIPRRVDRFVLTAGHGSALPCSLLYLTGYDLMLEDLKQFRVVLPNGAKDCKRMTRLNARQRWLCNPVQFALDACQ